MASPLLLNKNITMKINQSSAGKPSRKVKELAKLCSDLEDATYALDDPAAVSDVREKSSSQAEYAKLLFRNYRKMLAEKYEDRNEHGDDCFMGITSGCSGIGLDGSDEVLHGDSALSSFIVKLRGVVGLFSGLSFIVLVSLKNFHYTRLDASTLFRDDKQECSDLAESMNGYFDLTLYHIVASSGFLMCFASLVLIFYYFQPMDHRSGQKYVPGLSGLLRADPEWVSNARRFSDWIHRHNKLIELCMDGTLLAYGLFFSISASIALDSGNRFTVGGTTEVSSGGGEQRVSVQYYTMSTLYATFSHNTLCVEGRNPADSVRAGLSLLYIAIFALALCFRVSYSAFRKTSIKRQRALSLSPYGHGHGDRGTSPLLYSHHHSGSGNSFEGIEDGLSPGLADRMMGVSDIPGDGGVGVIEGSDSELDVVLNSTQSELSFHGDDGNMRGESSSDSDDDDKLAISI